MQTVEDNAKLTQVWPSISNGELTRRYGHPVAVSADLADRLYALVA